MIEIDDWNHVWFMIILIERPIPTKMLPYKCYKNKQASIY